MTALPTITRNSHGIADAARHCSAATNSLNLRCANSTHFLFLNHSYVGILSIGFVTWDLFKFSSKNVGSLQTSKPIALDNRSFSISFVILYSIIVYSNIVISSSSKEHARSEHVQSCCPFALSRKPLANT